MPPGSPSPASRPPLVDALAATVDLDDALRREEHSLAVRRAAFDHHSTLAWRSALASRAGVRHVALPPVSALLATKRPEMLDFALRQVARQRGAEVELVLAAHGFEPDRDAVRRALGDRPHQVLTFDGATSSATSSPPRRAPRRARCCSRSTTTTGTHPTPSTTC